MYASSLPVIDKLLTVTLKEEKESMLIESAFHFSTTFVYFFFINPFAPSFMSSMTTSRGTVVLVVCGGGGGGDGGGGGGGGGGPYLIGWPLHVFHE